MIGDDHCVGTDLQGPFRVLGVQDALQDQLAAPAIPDPLDVVPAELRIKLLGDPQGDRSHVVGARCMTDDVTKGSPTGPKHAQAPSRLRRDIENIGERDLGRSSETVLDVPVTLTNDLQIKRKDQCGASRGFRPVDQASDEIAVLHDIKLEPERLIRIGCHVLDRANAHGRERVRNSCLRRGASDENLTISTLHSDDAGRRQRDRHADWLPHHRGGKRAIRYINGNALA